MLLKKPVLSSLFLCFIFLLGCASTANQNNALFYDVGEDGLIPDYSYEFSNLDSLLDESSKDSKYNLFLELRFSDRCKIQTLPLKIEFFSLQSDTIFNFDTDINLFSDNDKFTGKGNFGIYENKIPVWTCKKIPEGLTFSVSTPEKNTDGIISIGIIYSKCN